MAFGLGDHRGNHNKCQVWDSFWGWAARSWWRLGHGIWEKSEKSGWLQRFLLQRGVLPCSMSSWPQAGKASWPWPHKPQACHVNDPYLGTLAWAHGSLLWSRKPPCHLLCPWLWPRKSFLTFPWPDSARSFPEGPDSSFLHFPSSPPCAFLSCLQPRKPPMFSDADPYSWFCCDHPCSRPYLVNSPGFPPMFSDPAQQTSRRAPTLCLTPTPVCFISSPSAQWPAAQGP